MAIPSQVRLPFAFDPAPLVADLAGIGPSDWVSQTFRSHYQGRWDVVPLRAAAGETHKLKLIYADPAATDFADTVWLDRLPAFRAALERFECPLRSVRLMRLTAGSEIREHVDDLDSEVGNLRLHVPVTTNAGVDFRLGGRRVEMAPGSVWYLRLSDPHKVANRGATDRIHLVLDATVNAWLKRMLLGGESVSVTELRGQSRFGLSQRSAS
ncbi:MAG TPA: aspartyl/asparaginyl beta-hydroxylase domain-containing protein [Allosphingosinicella sp.]|nr:aspartyl/asparaginyl beta-hydroxylase domain-containing protein [Allosphingosinicella sp.]